MSTVKRQMRLGLIVNPYAGIGGAAGLKGSDGEGIRLQALTFDSALKAPKRLAQMLMLLTQEDHYIHWFTAKGVMGGDYLSAFTQVTTLLTVSEETTALDTQKLAKALLLEKIDLIIFVGGDGTARDIVDVVGLKVPVLGLPSGVKMQSGVFAISPKACAQVILGLLSQAMISVFEADVRDIDEAGLRQNKVLSRYFGSMMVPDEPRYIQRVKQGGIEIASLVLDDIADYLTELMHEGRPMLIGPGKTLDYFMSTITLPNTLVGFDFIISGKLVAADVTSKHIAQLVLDYPEIQLLLSPTGQQGVLIGRGNQQLTPAILEKIEKKNWHIVLTKSKLKALEKRPLLVDSGDELVDIKLSGLYPVITGFDDKVLYPVNVDYASNNMLKG